MAEAGQAFARVRADLDFGDLFGANLTNAILDAASLDTAFLNDLTTDPQRLINLSHTEYLRESGSEGIELVMWMIMRGALGDGAKEVYRHYQAGSNDIVREMFDSSLRAGRYVLENVGMSEFEAAIAEETFYPHDRRTIRELAQLWDPSIPPAENAAYVARSKELERELETELYTALAERGKQDAA